MEFQNVRATSMIRKDGMQEALATLKNSGAALNVYAKVTGAALHSCNRAAAYRGANGRYPGNRYPRYAEAGGNHDPDGGIV